MVEVEHRFALPVGSLAQIFHYTCPDRDDPGLAAEISGFDVI